MPGSDPHFNPNGFWQVKCEVCRVIYGWMDSEKEAVTASELHVHRIELTRKEVKWQRMEATSSTYKPEWHRRRNGN